LRVDAKVAVIIGSSFPLERAGGHLFLGSVALGDLDDRGAG